MQRSEPSDPLEPPDQEEPHGTIRQSLEHRSQEGGSDRQMCNSEKFSVGTARRFSTRCRRSPLRSWR